MDTFRNRYNINVTIISSCVLFAYNSDLVLKKKWWAESRNIVKKKYLEFYLNDEIYKNEHCTKNIFLTGK